MNFAARHSLIKPKDSLTQQQFSVKSAIIHPYSLSFHKNIIVNSTDWAITSMLDWPSISTPTGGKIWSSEADLWWDVEQVLLAEHDLPKDDGRERIPWKPDRWVATVPLQVNVRFEQGLSGYRALRSFMNCFRYRDDGFKLWNALHNYVDKVVNGSYPSEEVIHICSNISIFHWSCFGLFRGAVKELSFFLGIIPKPVDPPPLPLPIGTFRNKNLNFGQV